MIHAAGVGLLCLLVGWGLGEGEEVRGGGLSEALEPMPGVRAAAVIRTSLHIGDYNRDAVANTEPDATVKQIAAVLDRPSRWRRGLRGREAGSSIPAVGCTSMAEPRAL